MARQRKVSIIVPAYNEEENILPLFEAFGNLRNDVNFDFELIIVDDGSVDKTAERTKSLLRHFRFARLISYSANRGKTYAVLRGFEASDGDYIVIFDADLQFDPKDIPPMIEKLEKGADIVAGYKIGKYQKPFVSKIYNLLGKILFGVPVKDMNALKAIRREVLEQMPFRPDWHRYIVIWAYKNGFKIVQHPVKLRPRRWGVSKYSGLGRVLIGFFDMLSVWFQLKFVRRPMLFFGTLGLFGLSMALLVGIAALILRFGYGLGYRPLLNLAQLLTTVGLLLVIGGFLGEMVENISERIRKIEQKINTNRFTPGQNEKSRRTNDKKRKKRGNSHSKQEHKLKDINSRSATERNRTTLQKNTNNFEHINEPAQTQHSEQKENNTYKSASNEKESDIIAWGRRRKKSSR